MNGMKYHQNVSYENMTHQCLPTSNKLYSVKRAGQGVRGDLSSGLGLGSIISLMKVGPWKHYLLASVSPLIKHGRLN